MTTIDFAASRPETTPTAHPTAPTDFGASRPETDRAGWYPNPGKYLAWWKRNRARVQQGGLVQLWWNSTTLDQVGFTREIRHALDKRINAKGGLVGRGRKWDQDYERGLVQDAYDLRNHLTGRLRIYQLRTPELRKRFAHHLSSYRDEC